MRPVDPKPLDLQPERALLSSFVIEPGLLARFRGEIDPSDFYLPEHGKTYSLLLRMVDDGVAIDQISVMTMGQRLGVEQFGGVVALSTVADHAPSSANARTYARLFLENARIRKLRRMAEELLVAANGHGRHGDAPAEEIATRWSQQLAGIGVVRGATSHESSFHEALLAVEEDRLDREAGSKMPPVDIGFPKLQEILRVKPGQLVVIGGEPSMGKSALAQAFTCEATRRVGRVVYFTLEMPKLELAPRFGAYLLGIPTARIEAGEFEGSEERDYRALLANMERGRHAIHIVDKPGATVDYVVAVSREQWARGGLKAVVVDHLHLMRLNPRESKHVALGEVTSRLKELARELEVPVLLLSQLNRSAQRRPDPTQPRARGRAPGPWWDEVAKPQLDDLRESGAIEADADIVLFPLHASKCGLSGLASAGCVVVAKQRGGALGTVGVSWDGPCAAYRPYSQPLFEGAGDDR